MTIPLNLKLWLKTNNFKLLVSRIQQSRRCNKFAGVIDPDLWEEEWLLLHNEGKKDISSDLVRHLLVPSRPNLTRNRQVEQPCLETAVVY